jgi:hypothetical protein
VASAFVGQVRVEDVVQRREFASPGPGGNFRGWAHDRDRSGRGPVIHVASALPAPQDVAVKVAVAVPEGWIVACAPERLPRTALPKVIGRPGARPGWPAGWRLRTSPSGSSP